MAKGGNYEREIAKQLSLWWSDNVQDDIFWRTSQSGGRATQRKKSGKSTANAYGDITFTDVSGYPLIKFCAIELKIGYKNWSIMDSMQNKYMVKTKEENRFSQYEKFLQQAEKSRDDGSIKWAMLITRRNAKQSLVHVDFKLHVKLREYSGKYQGTYLIYIEPLNDRKYVVMNFEEWVKWANPQVFKDLMKEDE